MGTFGWVGWVVCWCGFLVLVFVHSVAVLYFVGCYRFGVVVEHIVTGLFLIGWLACLFVVALGLGFFFVAGFGFVGYVVGVFVSLLVLWVVGYAGCCWVGACRLLALVCVLWIAGEVVVAYYLVGG